jgi:non-ribosomal peptide synthetase component E (peptide arylation enzyme)
MGWRLPLDYDSISAVYAKRDSLVETGTIRAKVAFGDPERSITYAELQATCQFARQLKALGLRQEERTILLLFDGRELFVSPS